MTTCKGCGRDMDRQSTHWEGCHEHHPECASYREGFKAGREQGMRGAADIAKRFEPDERHPHVTYPSDAILAAIRSPSAAKENIERLPCDCEYPDAERKWHFIPGVGLVVTCQRLENCECSRRKGDLP